MKMSQRVILCDISYSFFNYLKILYSNFAYFATPMTILLFIPFKFGYCSLAPLGHCEKC